MKRLAVVLPLILIFSLGVCINQGGTEELTIQNEKLVFFDYTLTVDEEIIESSKEKGPLQYTHGEGKIIPGLSKQLQGLKVGDEKKIEVAPEEGYGQINPDAFQEVPKSDLPPDTKPEVGMLLQFANEEGAIMIAKIAEVKDDTIVIDFNHPLAGKTLIFDVKIVSIE